ncbi:putative ribosomal protein L22 [Candidatus Carsonella ruddii PV]|uniref:50S ribosomal protein L22 n=2 Tax=Carsonella ruddii TaxID=114186 RepID=Q9AIG0_CARRU|nr:50S ribosomal protein L22 [Candidatus Carsonella ruddii]AAK17086.1 ribosomal protein L22 [Candidatus Carsonella ruddii]BAF35182.1 putative ribosomal protein L22 [Candidatus Carsonella ruddii PV]
MIKKFFFKNLPISYKKMYSYSKLLSNIPIDYFFYLNFTNKINFILKKIAFTIINCINSTKIFIKNFLINKGIYYKKINYRAKGKIDFVIKRYTNIILKVYGKKN